LRQKGAMTSPRPSCSPKQTFGRLPSGVAQIGALAVHGARATVAFDIVEAILNARRFAAMTPAVLVRPVTVGWEQQQMAIRFGPGVS
jgi:hypothetical protein